MKRYHTSEVTCDKVLRSTPVGPPRKGTSPTVVGRPSLAGATQHQLHGIKDHCKPEGMKVLRRTPGPPRMVASPRFWGGRTSQMPTSTQKQTPQHQEM